MTPARTLKRTHPATAGEKPAAPPRCREDRGGCGRSEEIANGPRGGTIIRPIRLDRRGICGACREALAEAAGRARRDGYRDTVVSERINLRSGGSDV